jgi:hypothetical protein
MIASFEGFYVNVGWSADGTALYFVTPRFDIVAARFRRSPAPVLVAMDTLFNISAAGVPLPGPGGNMDPAGERLISGVAGSFDLGAGRGRLVLVENFFEELNEAVPVD